MSITYQKEDSLSVSEFKDILIRSTLAERRPIDNHEALAAMCHHANLFVTARDDGKLVGIARSLSDFTYCTYLSELAVDTSYQHRGIGKELIRRTRIESKTAKVILISAPKAVNFYPKIGMTRHDHCYFLKDENELV